MISFGHFSAQDFLDLQVWFNLTWTGHRARKEKIVLRELLKKGKEFTEADKASLLDIQKEVIQRIVPSLPLHAFPGAGGDHRPALSTIPFFPCSWTGTLASRAMPKVALPGSFSHPEDAEAQIQKAVALYEEYLWKPPRWDVALGRVGLPEDDPPGPAGGNPLDGLGRRSPLQVLPGEPVRSASTAPTGSGSRERALHGFPGPEPFGPDRFYLPEESTPGFRRRPSDPPEKYRPSLPPDGDGLVLIALDGENPWEYYPDGG